MIGDVRWIEGWLARLISTSFLSVARRGHAGCANTYTTSVYDEGTKDLLAALQSSGFDMTHLHNHEAVESFPLERFDAVVLSDIPADSLLLPHAVFVKGLKRPNNFARFRALGGRGGELLMVGAYMTFSGFEVRALRADAARCYVACGDCSWRRSHRRAAKASIRSSQKITSS